MIELISQAGEEFDEESGKFIKHPKVLMKFEHSLVSVSKWESKYKKPFLDSNAKTNEELIDYLRFMIVNDVPDDALENLTQEQVDQLTAYIESTETATWFYNDPNKPKSRQIITSELIYFWVFSYRIDMATEKWHLNRLLTLIRIHNENNPDAKPKKRSVAEITAERRHLNKLRRNETGSSG